MSEVKDDIKEQMFPTTRSVIFEKRVDTIKVKSHIDFQGWWCEEHQGQTFQVRHTTIKELEEFGFDTREMLDEDEIYDVYLIVGPEEKHWVIPKKFCIPVSRY